MPATPVQPPDLPPPPTPQPASEALLPPPGPPGWPAEPPRPMRVLGTWRLALLAAGAAASALFAVYTTTSVRLLQRAMAGAAVTDAELATALIRTNIVSLGQLVLWLATMTVFLIWFHRGYRNVRSLGTTAPRFGTGWAVGSWFVPILNLVRPKQIADELWRASRPAAASDGTSDEGPDEPRMVIVHLWWTLFLGLGAFQLLLAAQMYESAADLDPEALLSALQGSLIASVIDIAFYLLTFMLVYGITVGQEARIARLVAADGALRWRPTPAAPIGAATSTLLLLAVLTLPIDAAALSPADIAAAGIRLGDGTPGGDPPPDARGPSRSWKTTQASAPSPG
jgi:hypothetical protein